jgi:hypothetical protein
VDRILLSDTQLRGLELVLSNVGGVSPERAALTEGPLSLLAIVRAQGRARGIQFHRAALKIEGSVYINAIECPHCGRK